MLRLVVKEGVRIFTIEEKRAQVEKFYLDQYKMKIHPSQLKDPSKVLELYREMLELGRSLSSYYQANPKLKEQDDYRRGYQKEEKKK